MIDALVTMAIATAGICGSALVLMQAHQRSREAGIEYEALRLAQTVAEELRTLRRPDGLPLGAATGTDPVLACSAAPASCAVEQQAAQALARWQARVSTQLPLGSSLQLELPDSTVSDYHLHLSWPGSPARSLHWRVST